MKILRTWEMLLLKVWSLFFRNMTCCKSSEDSTWISAITHHMKSLDNFDSERRERKSLQI